MQKEIEERKNQEAYKLQAIKNLDAKIPRQTSKIGQLETNEKKLRSDLFSLEEEIERIDMKLTECHNSIENEKVMTVSEQEWEKIVSAKAEVEKQIDEQDQITAVCRQNLIENTHGIEKAGGITAKMENLFNINFDTETLKQRLIETENLKSKIVSEQNAVEKLNCEITTCAQIEEVKQKALIQLSNQQDVQEAAVNNEVGKRKKKLKERQNTLRQLAIEESAHAETNQRLMDEKQLLFTVASNVIKHMSSSFDAKI